MSGIIRPPRGRQNKITKPSNASRRPGRQSLAAVEQAIHPTLDDSHTHHYPDPDDHADHAPIVVADHVMAGVGAGAEVDDDPTGAAAAAAAAEEAHKYALGAAASILANGGMMGGDDQQQATSAYPASSLSGDVPPPSQVSLHHAGMDFGHPPPQQPSAPENAGKTTEEVAGDSGYGGVQVESALAKRLAREPGLRPAHQRRPEQALNLSRRSNVEALFAHIAGDEVAVSCKNCHKGHGPWTACVVVDGQMCGSCANCWFNASGARCSFHETRNPQAHHLGALPAVQQLPEASPYVVQVPMALAPGNFNLGAVLTSTDPNVLQVVSKAFAEVRAADKKAREMMGVEILAKQLALQITKYEEEHGQDDQPPPPSAGMDDEQGP